MNNKILLVMVLFFSLFILSCASVKDDGNSGLAGIYAGVIPAADCPGISVVVILSANDTYKITYQYIDRDDKLFVFTGTFSRDTASKLITLNSRELPAYYRVGPQSLIQLDMEGKEIKGEFAKMYILRKI